MNRRRPCPHRVGRRRWSFGIVVLALVTGCTVPNLPAPLPPDATTGAAPPPPVVGGVISIGVDDDLRGFNPYVASQWSPAGVAVANLVLPGAFTPGATAADGVPTELLDRVAVTSGDPFTVTYELNQGAAWSDGTPIAAEDFTYLWQQMTANSDVISPGGYQLISDIQSADAGKTVVVVFRTPYADWRTLFSPLLPARTLKDGPGGFGTALQAGIPVAGGRYRMEGYDAVTGQVTLVRNDKYWAPDAPTSSVVLRAGAAPDLVESLGRGDVQAVYLRPGEAAAAALAGLGTGNRQVTVPLPAAAEIAFNLGDDRATADAAVRSAVAAAVDATAVRAALADGNPAATLPAISPFVLPASAAASDVAPAGSTDGAEVSTLLAGAGYERTGLYWRNDADRVLTLVLGYDAADAGARTAARLLQRQLGAAGVQLNLVAQTSAEVGAPLTAASVPDLVLAVTPRSASDRGRAATVLSCAAGYPQPTAGTTAGTPTPPAGAVEEDVGAPGFCDDAVRAAVTTYLAGGPADEVDALARQRLSVLPLGEPVATLAVGPAMAAVPLPTDPSEVLWSGALATVPDWPPPL